jgi:hypothetical protein
MNKFYKTLISSRVQGNPTKYLQLNVQKVSQTGEKSEVWDRAVYDASEEYKKRMVCNLFF